MSDKNKVKRIAKQHLKDNAPKTLAQEIFSGKKLLVERPDNMEYGEYRMMLRMQSQMLKMLFRKAPDYRIYKLLMPYQPSISISRGFRKTQGTRKAS